MNKPRKCSLIEKPFNWVRAMERTEKKLNIRILHHEKHGRGNIAAAEKAQLLRLKKKITDAKNG